MNDSYGLLHGEIVVVAGLIALTALVVCWTLGFAVAYLVTREPKAAVATVAVPRFVPPTLAESTRHAVGAPTIAVG